MVLDLHMPAPDGFGILDQVQMKQSRDDDMSVLVLTADISPAAKTKALSLGPGDLLTKPADQVDLLVRVRNLLQTTLFKRQWRALGGQETAAAWRV